MAIPTFAQHWCELKPPKGPPASALSPVGLCSPGPGSQHDLSKTKVMSLRSSAQNPQETFPAFRIRSKAHHDPLGPDVALCRFSSLKMERPRGDWTPMKFTGGSPGGKRGSRTAGKSFICEGLIFVKKDGEGKDWVEKTFAVLRNSGQIDGSPPAKSPRRGMGLHEGPCLVQSWARISLGAGDSSGSSRSERGVSMADHHLTCQTSSVSPHHSFLL